MALQQTLKALSDPTRREILNLLKSGKLSAGGNILFDECVDEILAFCGFSHCATPLS